MNLGEQINNTSENIEVSGVNASEVKVDDPSLLSNMRSSSGSSKSVMHIPIPVLRSDSDISMLSDSARGESIFEGDMSEVPPENESKLPYGEQQQNAEESDVNEYEAADGNAGEDGDGEDDVFLDDMHSTLALEAPSPPVKAESLELFSRNSIHAGSESYTVHINIMFVCHFILKYLKNMGMALH